MRDLEKHKETGSDYLCFDTTLPSIFHPDCLFKLLQSASNRDADILGHKNQLSFSSVKPQADGEPMAQFYMSTVLANCPGDMEKGSVFSMGTELLSLSTFCSVLICLKKTSEDLWHLAFPSFSLTVIYMKQSSI